MSNKKDKDGASAGAGKSAVSGGRFEYNDEMESVDDV